MCVIIDADVLSRVFSKANVEHHEFEPVLKWIMEGPGRVVYGGTKYREHLLNSPRYLALFTELSRLNKVCAQKTATVDLETEAVLALEADPDFDDPHIVAILRVSGCRLVCTDDKRSHKFLHDAKFYRDRAHRPSIYSSSANADLLCRKMIGKCCDPVVELNKAAKSVFKEYLAKHDAR